ERRIEQYAVAQLGSKARLGDLGALLCGFEAGAHLRSVRTHEHAALELDLVPEQSHVAQLVEIDERHAPHPGLAERIERAHPDALVDASFVEQALQSRARIHAALENPATVQIDEAVREHFAAA